jgi:predicted permease
MRFYRALLHLYPASFRAEYGADLCALFESRLRRSSGVAAAALWAGAFADVVWNAVAAHADLLRQDLRYSIRTLRRTPGFALTAIVVAALGIGATTAAFSLADRVLIRPLPFPDPDRLVAVWQDQSFRGYSRMEASPPNYLDWKASSRSFESMAAYHGASFNLVGYGPPARIEGIAATAELLPMLGARALVGRTFRPEDDRPGAPGTVLLSEGLWTTQFGAAEDVVGRRVLLDGDSYEVIGVLEPGFRFPNPETQFWIPARFDDNSNYSDRTNNWLRVLGRLKRGVSVEAARTEMRLIASRLERAYPKENARTGASVIPLKDEKSEQSRLLLATLLGASMGVLLIACTNLASLLLARGLARRRELAVRTAMGAGRERLVRQLLTESLLLAFCGGALGVLLAAAAVPLMARLVPTGLPIAAGSGVDLRVLLFAGAVTAVTGLAFGILPALRACGNPDSAGLRESARSGESHATEKIRSLLVIAEVTVSVALLIASGLLVRALWRLQAVDPGFRAEGVLTLRTPLPTPKYDGTEMRDRFYERVLSEVRGLPGVTGAAYVGSLPMVMRGGVWPLTLDGEAQDAQTSRMASLRIVTPGFFATLGIPVKLGRDVAASDTQATPSVALVSESFARRCWPGVNPIGRRFRIAFHEPTVVGVVGDVRVRGLERESEPQVYLPSRQLQDGQIVSYIPRDLVIRSSAAPATLLPAIRRIVARADPELPVASVRLLTEIVSGETAPRRVQLAVLGAFSAAALLLAAIGIHGLLAFTVSRRAREIGVRLALGARSSDILRMVLRRGVLLAVLGILPGAGLAYAAGRVLERLLAGVHPADAGTFAAAAALTFFAILAGSFAPALRAVRVDPMTAMRSE